MQRQPAARADRIRPGSFLRNPEAREAIVIVDLLRQTIKRNAKTNPAAKMLVRLYTQKVVPLRQRWLGPMHLRYMLHRRPRSLAPVLAIASAISADDTSLVQRVVRAYRHGLQLNERATSMWEAFFDERHRSSHEIFASGSFEDAGAILRDPTTSDLFWGFDGHCASILKMRGGSYDRAEARVCLDGLVTFGEAIGAIKLDYPEAYSLKRDEVLRTDTTIKALEDFLGLELVFPNPFPKEVGIKSEKGVISYRVPQALYQAWRIKQLVSAIPNPRVLEIGGGLGRTAYYARLFGITDYTIIDLPFTGLSQGYFLGRTLGEDGVQLYGEAAANPANAVKILPPSSFLGGSEKYDLIVNVDSLPEMGMAVAQSYVDQIAKRSPLFLSINHDAGEFRVAELMKQKAEIASVDRRSYWMRRGYVEELVRFKN
jgi:hypothetical protein